ncbi:MAG: ABC transporter ATP-binding protein [Acidimicrobiaceae bacterium]|nr:ABC transporter ATP-binding protein [Acidimicrobiaceae bacterium]
MIPGDKTAIEGAKLRRSSMRRVAGFARPYKRSITGFLVSIFIAAIIALIPPFLFRMIVDQAIPAGDKRRIITLTVVLVAAALSDALLQIIQRWYSARIGEGLIYDLRVALFDKVQNMPIAFFTRTQTGALISRLNNDVIGAQTAVTGTLGSVVSNFIVLTTTLAAMLALEWRLTLLALIILPVFIVPARRVGLRLQEIAREQMGLNAAMNTQMTERFNVSGAMLVKLFGRHKEEVGAFASRAIRVRDIGITSAMYGRVFFVALGLVGALGAVAIYGIGAFMVVAGGITIGTLVAMAAFVQRIYQPLIGLTNASVDIMTALVSFERVFEVLDAPVAITDRPGAVEIIDPRGAVEFDHVTFRYPPAATVSIPSLELLGVMQGSDPDTDVLTDVSLSISPGETIALVGASGTGKTTLAMLLARLYDVTAGAVRLDGHDVRDLTSVSLRAAIGVVSQDSHMFHESVKSNLVYAHPDATEEQMVEACRAAKIHDVITALPDGYETIVGERGYRLSGGEKQRLAIARLLLKNPAVMILDEATSHLDNEGEILVQLALEAAMKNRTAIVIAHRLSTIRDADRIVVLNNGMIAEQGTHDQLMNANSLYASQVRAGEGFDSANV